MEDIEKIQHFKIGDKVKIKSRAELMEYRGSSHGGESFDVNTKMISLHGTVTRVTGILHGDRFGHQKLSLKDGDGFTWYGYLVKKHSDNKLNW